MPPRIQKSLTPAEKITSQIKYILDDPVLANAQIGVYIQSISDNSVLFKQNEYKLFVPASNQKLYTTASALELLGENFRYETRFISEGDVSDSTLLGNLIIRGQGDPSISGRFRQKDVLAYFNDWADSLKSKGIVKIDGSLIGDESYFKGNKLGWGWNWDDEPFWYSAQIGALSYNDNCVDIKVFAGKKAGDAVSLQLSPKTDYLQINNRAYTVAKDSLSTFVLSRARGKNIIELQGALPEGEVVTGASITVEEPALWFLDTFYNVLKKHGISVKKGYMLRAKNLNADIPQRKLLFKHCSPDLAKLVKVVNKESHNFYAEQIFKTLGAELNKKGSAEGASKVVMQWLNSIAVTEFQAKPVDGSGLSRMNLISPYSTATLLKYMYQSKNFEPFYESLPIAGVDGTLKNLMKNSVAQGVVRAKSGTMTHVRSLAGYTTDRSGNDYLFVIMANSFTVPVSYIKEMQAKICILLTGYDPKKN